MATTSKLSFRARNLDATKSMPVYCADELPDLAECTPINRAVAQMPTGMEKDEENESHLQEAILAQQASTSGIAVENHVIPTPKVFTVESGYYDALYPVQPRPSENQLIKVQASLSLANEEPSYDIDSEDEAWLADRGGHIAKSDFEKMMELLEGASSGLQICQPAEARILLKDFDSDLVDDVYDYWLQKRKDAAAVHKIASLIPRVKTDARRDALGSDIAYVAFRRRLERMQTRKNRKNDEESYEKILKLGSDLGRASCLFDMLRRREHVKRAVLRLDSKICKCRWSLHDFGCICYRQCLAKVKLDRNAAMSPTDESQDELGSGSSSPTKVKGHKRKRHSRNSICEGDKDIVTRAWLRKNAELWNKPATAASVLNAGTSPVTASTVDAERNAEAAVDGRYTFKRRRGCIYRSSLFANLPEARKVKPAERFYRTFLPTPNGTRYIGYARRRMGRGGRIIFDRLLFSPPSTSQSAPDPPFHSDIDITKTYQCKLANADCDDNDSSDFDENRNGNVDNDYEVEYNRREELYAKRIFGMSYNDNRQRLQPGTDSGIGSSRGAGEHIVVLGEDSNGSASGNGQSVIINGVHEATDRLRVVNLQQNGPPLEVRAGAVSECGPQPVLLTASVAGKVEKVAPLRSNSPSVNFQPKRVQDHSSSRVTVQMPISAEVSSSISSSSTTSEASPVFYTHLPPPLPQTAAGLVATGEQETTIQQQQQHHPARTFDYTSSSGVLNPSQQQQMIITTNQQPLRQQDHILAVSLSQEVIVGGGGGQNLKPRIGGRRRSIGSLSVAQLVPSLSRSETALQQQRMSTYGLNGDIIPQATSCVDTKRLELAIKGSGARIRSSLVAQPILQSYPHETKTLRDLLLGTAAPTNKAALTAAATITPAVTRMYTIPPHVPAVVDTHRYVPFTSNVVTTSSYYVPATASVSSPGSESMSPSTPHALSPAIQQQNPLTGQSYFGVTEPEIQTPVAVISNSSSSPVRQSSLNGTAQVDKRHSSGVIVNKTTTNGGRKREIFSTSNTLQRSVEAQQRLARYRRMGGRSSPLVPVSEKSVEGSATVKGAGNAASAATAAAAAAAAATPATAVVVVEN